MTTKKISPQSIIGQLGANLIERVALQMKYVWRPLLIFDVGVDGEIEICDPVPGEVTGAFGKVQAKATTEPFVGVPLGILLTRRPRWRTPVLVFANIVHILIVCRP